MFGVCLNGNVKANMYQNLLQQHAIIPLRASPNQPANCMQDNTPCYTDKRVKNFLDDVKIEILKWPAQSLDLNPIKNLNKIIGGESNGKKTHPQLPNYGTNLMKS